MKKFIKFILNIKRGYKYFYENKYVANKSTNEIHLMGQNCRALNTMSEKNKIYLSEYDLKEFLIENKSANGCYLCNREMDTDKFKR